MAMYRKEGMLWITLAVCCAIVLTACGGCTDSAPGDITDRDITVITNTPSTTPSTGQQVYGNLVIDVPDFVQHWKADGTCFWEGRIHVTNTGDTPEMNVVIRSYLLRTADGEKEYVDSKTLQRVNPGESLSYISQLSGSCDTDYYIVVKADTE
ncbi:hypothetical protein L1S32_04310 [Methanogenium sp. S4BF]|uniref:hypothetical protein n=1 Tax=Methanogenium sp. S4BF TaxID=1789226 RepID=UPI0024161B31|nr:hypothetical protein [Methanogenium sp. S4BF]WFN35351.1 hypothetical protein L1S32_04310 [Methanogenium sp. S4BF]